MYQIVVKVQSLHQEGIRAAVRSYFTPDWKHQPRSSHCTKFGQQKLSLERKQMQYIP